MLYEVITALQDNHVMHDPKQPIEILRTIHSFDPCIACAVHVITSYSIHYTKLYDVTMDAEGLSTLDETACPGVWWITHRDTRDKVLSEFIEVTLVPELIMAHPEDIKIGLEYLEGVISQLS